MKTRSLLIGVAAVALGGLALWYFQSRPAAPRAVRAVQSTVPASAPLPLAEMKDSSLVASAPPQTVGESRQSSLAAPAHVAPIQSVLTAPAVVEIPAVQASAAQTTATNAPAAEKTDEAAATAHMYAAHASLRTPEVADPDSKSNRQILQTMVLKALARQTATASR